MIYQQTKQWSVGKTVDNLRESLQLLEAAQLLKDNQVVAFPTETVYGLGGNAKSDQAIQRIFEAKGRPTDNPLIVHISTPDQLTHYVQTIPTKAKALMDAFWPGPLTIVLEHNGELSTKVTAGLPTVAVRIPDHPVALALIEATQLPIAAPSANRSGRPSPTTAEHVFDDLNERIAGIVDGGPTGVGVESTVVDCTGKHVMILRPGGITTEAIEKVIGEISLDPSLEKAVVPRSPGMKYTHYAPSAPLFLVDGTLAFFREQVTQAKQSGKKVGALVTNEHANASLAHKEVLIGSKDNLAEVANKLYTALRAFSENEVDIIFAEVFPETDLGGAIMNRLKKASAAETIRQR